MQLALDPRQASFRVKRLVGVQPSRTMPPNSLLPNVASISVKADDVPGIMVDASNLRAPNGHPRTLRSAAESVFPPGDSLENCRVAAPSSPKRRHRSKLTSERGSNSRHM